MLPCDNKVKVHTSSYKSIFSLTNLSHYSTRHTQLSHVENHTTKMDRRLVTLAKPWLDKSGLEEGFCKRSFSATFPLLNTWQWFCFLNTFEGEELHSVSKVGTLNMKMLDHLLEIGDNPVRLQLLEAMCVRWICCLFCGSNVYAVCSQT